MHATLREKHFESVVVASDRLMAAIPEGHPATQCLAVSLSALAQETFFIPKPHSHPGIYEVTVSACEKAGFTPMQIQPMRLLQTAIALVAGGLGVALVPETFKANVQVKGVVYHPLCGTAPIAELIAVWHHQNHSPIVTRLRNELRKPLRNAAG
jgi:DNA-binding transcriptional LysR family regulator